MTPLRLITLDLSLRSPGYCWTTTPEGLPRLAVRTIKAGADLDEWECREAVLSTVRRLVAIRPHVCGIEDIFAGINSKTGIMLAKLHGVVEQELGRERIPIVRIHQAKRAAYATGNGGASKSDVMTAATYMYGRFVGGAARVRTTDDADALILAAMVADHYGQPLVEVDGTRRRALAGIKWPKLLLKEVSPATRPIAGPKGVTSPQDVPAALFVASPERTQL